MSLPIAFSKDTPCIEFSFINFVNYCTGVSYLFPQTHPALCLQRWIFSLGVFPWVCVFTHHPTEITEFYNEKRLTADLVWPHSLGIEKNEFKRFGQNFTIHLFMIQTIRPSEKNCGWGGLLFSSAQYSFCNVICDVGEENFFYPSKFFVWSKNQIGIRHINRGNTNLITRGSLLP